MTDASSGPPTAPARRSRYVRRLAIAVAALLSLWAVAWLAVPPLVKWQAEQRLTALLGRPVSIGRVAFSPWALALTVERLQIGAAAGADRREPQFSVERVHVNADLRSLARLAPVIEAIDVEGPRLRLTRLADGRYDIDDLLARLQPAAPTPEADAPPRFALYNLRLVDGAVEFDDRPVRRQHRLQGLLVTLPFLSNLPADVTVMVEPRLAFTLDGATFDSGAHSKPFAQDHATQLDLRVAELDLAHWLPYLPAGLPLRPARGLFASQLQLKFALPAGGPPRVSLSGQATLRDVAIVAGTAAGEPLVGWKQLQIGLADVQPLARRIGLSRVQLDGAHVDLRRDGEGRWNLWPTAAAAAAPVAVAPPSAAASLPAATPREPGWRVSIDQIELGQARIDWHDATTQPTAALRIDALDLSLQQVHWPVEAPAPLKVAGRLIAVTGDGDSTRAPEAAPFTVQGEVSDRFAKLALELQSLDLRWLAPYISKVLVPALDGRVSLATTLDWASGDAPRLAVGQLTARADSVRLSDTAPVVARTTRPAARSEPAVASVQAIAIADGSVDLLAQRIALGSLKIERPTLRLARDRAGTWNALAWARPSAAAARETAAARESAAAPAWHLQLGEAQLSGGEVRLHDEQPSATAGEPVRLIASGIQATVRGLAWPAATTARGTLQLRLAQDKATAPASAAGRVEWSGQFATAPLQARGALRIERAPVHVFEPYFSDGLHLSLLRAEASWRGDVAFTQRSGGIEASARGDTLLADVHVHEQLATDTPSVSTPGDELLGFQSLALRGMQFAMKPGDKPRLAVADAVLTDFYSRLVISEQGRFNLRDVAAPPAAGASAAARAASAPATVAVAAAPAAPAASGPAGAGGLPIDVSIGGTQLVNGKIDFTDRFIRPNYSAALTELNGRLGAFDSTSRAMATLELRGRAAGTALLEIVGSLNPTAQPLALDIRAKATDLELAPLSPYAGRYAGYAIERGKLSMDVAYKIDPDGKLDAKNQVILNQLTFGDKIESPDATKLPVLLAVALLKDRNGVIDINLPISGSINDPQFSVFGIVLKIIGNLLVKALTAPFALLAGGGSDDLSFVGFEPGTATVTAGGRDVIDKVAKALADRPALKMTVTGASDPVSEREAAQRAALEARIRAEQRRDALRAGAASDAPLPALTAAQREQLVKHIYGDTRLPNKPRNVIGLAKDIPLAEMEALLRQATPVTTDTARELALQRGLAVRDALIAKGLPSERLFVAAPKLRASGEDDAAWSPRVQLALSTN